MSFSTCKAWRLQMGLWRGSRPSWRRSPQAQGGHTDRGALRLGLAGHTPCSDPGTAPTSRPFCSWAATAALLEAVWGEIWGTLCVQVTAFFYSHLLRCKRFYLFFHESVFLGSLYVRTRVYRASSILQQFCFEIVVLGCKGMPCCDRSIP